MQQTIHLDYDVKNAIDLLAERGQDVAALRARLAEIDARLDKDAREADPAYQALAREVLAADQASDTGEPSELEAIQAARPADRTDRYEAIPTGDALADRVAGGWWGRIAGCILGKPVECLMREPDSRATLRRILQESGQWPLDDFISEKTILPYWESVGTAPAWFKGGNPSLREYIQFAPADDDLNYTALSLKIVRQFGRQFTPDDVLRAWLGNLPFNAVCTAERIAYRNAAMGLHYPDTARFLNPYREWIGAQIRTDLYGYICPGAPAEAARMAWSDAACSHTENGLYGAMWVSAAIAAAFVEDDPEAVIRKGLEQVPLRSRFTEHMNKTLEAARAHGEDCEATFDHIAARLGHYHCVHTINNACLVAAGLMHGGHDFGRVISVAVMGGLDTDCNGATAGSIAGVMLGKGRLDGRWTEPFHDTLHTSVQGYNEVRISDIVRQTVGLIG